MVIQSKVAERSDDVSAEKSTDRYVIEPGMETTQFGELILDENRVVVDRNKLCPVCLTMAKSQSSKVHLFP